MFFRQIRPLLKYFTAGQVLHSENSFTDFYRSRERGLNLAASSSSESGKLGFAIRMLRLEKGWSQNSLAKTVGLSNRHLSRVERGHCRPHLATIRRLELAFGSALTYDWLEQKNVKVELAQGTSLKHEEP